MKLKHETSDPSAASAGDAAAAAVDAAANQIGAPSMSGHDAPGAVQFSSRAGDTFNGLLSPLG